MSAHTIALTASLRASLVVAVAVAPLAATATALPNRTQATSVSVTRATLPNGLRIVVLRDRLAPAVTTWLNVGAGSDDEPYTGLAHAQEHMFFRGSTTLSGAAADEIAGFTGDQDNADTQSEVTQYFHLVPASDLGLVLQLDRARFHGILDAQRDWTQERGAIEQEVTRDNSDANYRLYVKLLHHIMAGTPYADEGLGTLHSFDAQIGAPQLRAFYARWYHPNNALYVIAGDVDPQATVALVRRFLGDVPAVPLPQRRPVRLAGLAPAAFRDTSDESTIEAMIGYRFPGYDDPDYAAATVLADVLNSQRAALFGLVADGRAQSVEADASQWPKGGMLQIIARVGIKTQPATALADLAAVVARYRESGVPAELVAAAKRREVVREQTAAASVMGLAQTWSESLAVEHRTPPDDVALVERVTPAAVDAVVRRYLVAETATTAYAVPKNGGLTAAASAGGAEESPKQAPSAVAPLPAWARAALRTLRPPERTIAPAAFTLPNGLRVVVQQERASPSVSVAGAVEHDAGLEEPAGKDGVQSLVEALLPYGTKTYSRVAFQAQIDAISATLTSGYAFTLSVPSAHFERGMQLLADDELHPALDPAALRIVRQERVDALAGDATNPDHLAAVAAANGLYPPGDPARRFATAQSVGTLEAGDVRDAYERSFRPDLTTIAIVGDVTPGAARAAVQRWFGSWRSTGARPAVAPPVVPNNPVVSTNVPAAGRLQDTIALDETLPLTLADPDYAPLQVAGTVLSGDFSSILIRDMRVTTGYVYYVGADLTAGKTRATFAVRYGCAPRNFTKAQRVLERDLRRLQTTEIDRDLLQRAKSHLVSTVTLLGTSYDGLAQRLLFNVENGLGPTHDDALARQALGVTPSAVRFAMSRWIRPRGFVRTVEGPAPN